MASATHAPVLCDEAVDALQVRADGRTHAEIVLPEISDALQLWYRSLVVHAPDGARVACGVVG